MKIRTRLFLSLLILVGVGFYALVDWHLDDLRPRYLEAMEEGMVDTATLLSSAMAQEFRDGRFDTKDLRGAFERAGNIFNRVGQFGGRPADGRQVFDFQQLAGFFFGNLFQIVGVGFQLPPHGDALLSAVQGDLQHVIVDGLGDEIGGLQFQAVDGQLHVAMTRNHDDLGGRCLSFDAAQEFDAVHTRHLDVTEHNGGDRALKGLERSFTVFRCITAIAEFGQVDFKNVTEIGFIINQQNCLFHFARPWKKIA